MVNLYFGQSTVFGEFGHMCLEAVLKKSRNGDTLGPVKLAKNIAHAVSFGKFVCVFVIVFAFVFVLLIDF